MIPLQGNACTIDSPGLQCAALEQFNCVDFLVKWACFSNLMHLHEISQSNLVLPLCKSSFCLGDNGSRSEVGYTKHNI